MAKTKNSPLAGGYSPGAGFSGLRRSGAASASMLSAAPGFDNVRRQIMAIGQRVVDLDQVQQAAAAASDNWSLQKIVAPELVPLLSQALASAYYWARLEGAKGSRDADYLLDNGANLQRPIEKTFLIGEIRWRLSAEIFEIIAEQQEVNEDLRQLLAGVSNSARHCRYSAGSGRGSRVANLSWRQCQQLVTKGQRPEVAARWSAGLSLDQQQAVAESLQVIELMFSAPERPDAYQRLDRALTSAQQVFGPGENLNYRKAANQQLNDWILGTAGALVENQLETN